MAATRCFILMFTLLGMLTLPAMAEDYVPILPGQTPDAAPDRRDNNPAPVAAGQTMAVPDYIKPGFQMTYMSMSSTEGNPQSGGGAGMGFEVHTIIAITKNKVWVTVTNYLTPDGIPLNADGSLDLDTDPKAILMGSKSYSISAMDVQGGNALWMPPKELKDWQTGNGVEVQRFPWPYQGKQVDSTTLFVKGNDFISSNTYRNDNGMKLVSRSGTGPMRQNATGNDPFDRKIQTQTQLLATRQIDSPLLGDNWPGWAKTVKKMTYNGTYRMNVPGSEGVPPVQMDMTIAFAEHGQGYAAGKSTLSVQGGLPESNTALQGPGTLLGYWVDPNLLNNLDEGTVDQHQLTRTKTTYKIQQGNLGRLGVFVVSNEAQTFYTVSGYNLKTGALTYVQIHTADPSTTVEFTLDEIESD